MSADNWTQCPKCYAKTVKERQAALAKVEKSYGKQAMEDWLYEKSQAEAIDPEEIGESLREDYNCGVNGGGVFEVSYSCSCNQCDFKFSFKHKVEVYPETKGTKP